MTQSTTPAGWYQDPTASQQLRYWDGAAWTSHVTPTPGSAPAVSVVAPSSERTGLPGAVIALIVVGVGVLLVAVLAAIAIPVFLNQQRIQQDAEVNVDAAMIGTLVAQYVVDAPDSSDLEVVQSDGTYFLVDDGTSYYLAPVGEGVTLGDFTMTDAQHWCLWLEGAKGTVVRFDSQTGVADGAC